LKLKYDKLLSNFAVNCNLRHYVEDIGPSFDSPAAELAYAKAGRRTFTPA